MLPDRAVSRARTWPVLMADPRHPAGPPWLTAVTLPAGVDRLDRTAAWHAAETHAAQTWPADGGRHAVPVRLGLAPLTVGELERVRALFDGHGRCEHGAAGVDVVDPRAWSGIPGLYVHPVHVPRDLFDIGPDMAERAGAALDRYRRMGPAVGPYTSHADKEACAIRCAAADVPDAFQLIGWRAWIGAESTAPTFATEQEARECMRVYGHTVRALKVDGVTVATFHSGARMDDGPSCSTYAGPPLLRVLGEQVDTMAERHAWKRERERRIDAGESVSDMSYRDMPAADTDYVRAVERPRLARLRAAVLDVAAMRYPRADVRYVDPETLAQVERDPRAAQLAQHAEQVAG